MNVVPGTGGFSEAVRPSVHTFGQHDKRMTPMFARWRVRPLAALKTSEARCNNSRLQPGGLFGFCFAAGPFHGSACRHAMRRNPMLNVFMPAIGRPAPQKIESLDTRLGHAVATDPRLIFIASLLAGFWRKRHLR